MSSSSDLNRSTPVKKAAVKKTAFKKLAEKKSGATVTAKRRVGSESSTTRLLLLQITKKLILAEGYAAVSSRRVAKEIEMKPSLVHYYFPTTDDLLLHTFRYAADEAVGLQDVAYNADKSLKKIWGAYQDKEGNMLMMEFMALANHRPLIRQEIASYTERTRQRRAESLAALIDFSALEPADTSAEGLSVLLIGIARTLVMEESLGVSLGHADAVAMIEYWLEKLEVKTRT